MTDIDEMTKEFRKFEEDLDLFTLRISGIPIWERIRFRVYNYVYNEIAGGTGSFSPGYTTKEKLSFYFRTLIDVFKNPFLSRQKDILFVSSARRLLYEDGIWWDIFTDHILDELDNFSYLLIEPDFRLQHKKPPRTRNLRYMDFIVLVTEIKKKLGIGRMSLKSEEKHVIKKIERGIMKRFSVGMNLQDLIINVLEKRKDSLPLYIKMLQKISPKVLVVVVSYGKENLIEAAKRLRIPVIELQHGALYPQHFGYTFPSKYASKHTFPDYLFVFGDYWVDSAEFPISSDKIISVGYPYMDVQRKKYANTKRKKQILIISQGGIGNSIPQFAVKLAELVDDEFEIVYKLHPGEWHNWRERYPELLGGSLHIIDTRDNVLYKLFAESCVQLGVSSSAIFEGLAFGLETYLIEAPSVEFLSKLVDSGFVKVLSSPHELIPQLTEIRQAGLFDKSHFFKPDAVDNIILFLQKLISS